MTKQQRKPRTLDGYVNALGEIATTPDFRRRASFAERAKSAYEPAKSLGTAKDAGLSGSMMFESLTQHAADLGQYPVTSFVGYGVLEQIAQNGMIRACIQTVADDMSRKWITLEDGSDADQGGADGADDETGASNMERLSELQEKKYRLQRTFNDAFAKMGYFGGCFIFIDTGAEGDELELPLVIGKDSAEFGPDRPLRFVVVDPVNVSPGVYNASDPLKPNYFRPQTWSVLGRTVHASRMIRLVDNEPPLLLKPAYNFLGIPQAQILWDYVLHWNSARVEAINLLKKLNFFVFQTNVEDLMNVGGLQALDSRMEAMNRYRSNDSLFVCDKTTEDVKNVSLAITGVFDLVKQSLEFVAAINRTPAVKLLGISPSGFNATGESDIRNYYDHILSKQEKFRDAINICLACIQLAEFGEIDPNISFRFNPLSEDDKASAAMTAQTLVGTLGMLLDRNVISAEELRDRVREIDGLNLGGLTGEPPEPQEGDLQTDDPEAGGGEQNPLLAALQGIGQEKPHVPESAPPEQSETDLKEA